jgi:hypothetical protein
MPVLKNTKHKEYARYAAHCLDMVVAAKDQDSRSVQREMAAEWLKLADTALGRTNGQSDRAPQLALSYRPLLSS